MKDEPMIHYDSDEAATFKQIGCWVAILTFGATP